MSLLGPSGIENHPDGTGNINALVNGNWGVLNEWVNPASGLTASQSGTTITASASIFKADDVGGTILFNNGQTCLISSVTSPTVAVASVSQTVSSQAWMFYRADVVQIPATALIRGLMKRARMLASDDGGYLQWSAALNRVIVVSSAQATLGSFETLGTTGTINIDFSTARTSNLPALTGNVTFTTSNLTPGSEKLVYILGGSSTRTLSFPSGWNFVGNAAPSNIVAGKSAKLALTSLGTTNAAVTAEWNVEA